MFGILFLIIFLCSAAVLVGLILGIVGLATDKKTMRNAGFIAFGLGLALLVCTIIYSINRAVNKVQEAFEPFTGLQDSLNGMDYSSDLTEDLRSYLLDDSSSNATMKYIVEASSKKNPAIKDSYYTYFGSSNMSRMPLIYPFAIHCWDSKNYGTLVDEEQVEDVYYTPGREVNVVFNIKRLAFDEHFILMETASNQDNNAYTVLRFTAFDLDKKLSKDFDTEKEMLKYAKKEGYKGTDELMTIWEYESKF